MPVARWSTVARPCRLIARRRYPIPSSAHSRRFHISRQWQSASSPPTEPGEDPPTGDLIDDIQTPNLNHASANSSLNPAVIDKSVARPYGSAVRRAMRNKQLESQQKVSPAATVPYWFSDQNTVVRSSNPDELLVGQPQQWVGIKKTSVLAPDEGRNNGLPSGPSSEDPPPSGESAPENRYSVPEELWMSYEHPSRQAFDFHRYNIRKSLWQGSNDGILFLDAVVRQLSQQLNTDLITLNAQDIAQLFSEQDFAETGSTSQIRSLGYEVYRPTVATWPEAEGDGEGEEEVADIASVAQGARTEVSTPRFITIEASRDTGDVPLPNWLGLKSLVASMNGQGEQDPSNMRHSWQRAEERWTRLLNEIITSLGRPALPAPEKTEATLEPNTAPSVLPRDTIIHVQDYRDIQSSRAGSRVISLLQKVIQDQRRAGSRIILIGTTSQELQQAFSQDGSSILQNVFEDNFSKTLVITPAMDAKIAEKTFAEDQRKRTMDINIRHLQSMLRYRLNENSAAIKDDIFGNRSWPLDSLTLKLSGIRDRLWSYNQVHWVATLALGSTEAGEPFGFEHIRRGIQLMDKGDQVTSEWLKEKSPKATGSANGQSREQLLSSLRKTCNAHEKKLLNGVVDAKSIRTTFDHVHVPPETVDALKTLTSLSLIRPEAFTYGVLATDKIPGLLLYGPPGTGKTLLAKAVARESGATVLEVSGSEVYDMYVGEGEKNVKAIFTLAKKLSPCVVFIDEADAIFCSRTGSSNRTSHRELINQFLREWDGLNDLSAFIMVATNRPFDLDDAVLRRLPRRLLVDLPTEQDRHEILKIHLKEEQLDPSVDLADLAKRTPLYSGSDLKNLAVAAALACVREENEAALRHQGDEPYTYPTRRTLTLAHFDRGMEEISASISEDMSSLSSIRKFDEQYGDRKSRRPKTAGLGFTSASDAPVKETVRVRE
ncbi:hypothetical protein N7468_007256 [Penicillium chermesinum]|uniref:AAA+ ATPase domain-containing protein n=1 Tax=Penicillium chermesinum TaxID=63820 RepID=A0A9W9NUH0_9EURO|nr:uncharacterized protein N7468_007256 [Penicillium chermesinum]KAJ5226031.1 hypothetical protein N7468_007256 [Penicillium chermesinum]